jgi:tetratricopeptide (TPR) repeat protein
MSVFKCKMCGGTIEFEPGATVGICDSCGTKQTLPRLDDDKKANLYDRANHYRRNNDFDKAMGIYEQILNEDNTDAEAYWSLVLCRYGIEYVEDPTTHKRTPTVNRAQFTSVYADEDYKSALQYADASQREIYEQEAKTIDDIQKGILEISAKEEPFDIFICFKETDASGRRTPDSVLATDLYHQLTQEGFKVFFSRITLEDKLGTAYEPYIFAALNSAKVMVVVGTKPEYFNAVWVKNEWSRYLALIKRGQKKTLIPAYRDMDPYDLPEEFSHLQAQDMSKLGFMQDLIRGIKKITNSYDVSNTVKSGTNTNIEALLKRAFLFLEDEEWDRANEYFENVLNEDPENGRAYIGKLTAEFKLKNPEELANIDDELENNSNYIKARRFGSADDCALLDEIIEKIAERKETQRKEKCYNEAHSAKEKGKYEYAEELFMSLTNYKDSEQQILECKKLAEEAKIANEKLEESKRLKKAKQIKILKRVSAAVCTLIVIWIFVLPGMFYISGKAALKNKNYDSALKWFSVSSKCGLYDIYNAEIMVETGVYETEGNDLYIAGEYEKAATLYKQAGKSNQILTDCYQKAGEKYLENKNYVNALKMFELAGDDNKLKNTRILYLEECTTSGNYEAAKEMLDLLLKTESTNEDVLLLGYNLAERLFSIENYSLAANVYKNIEGYEDSNQKFVVCSYQIGKQLMNTGAYDEAVVNFENAVDYEDAKELANQARYQYGLECMEKSDWKNAKISFTKLGNYQDASTLLKEASYQYAINLIENGEYTRAEVALSKISGYKDSKEKRYEAMYLYVKENNVRTSTVYSYLKELKSAKYENSERLYEQRFSWKVKMIFNDSETDEKTSMSSISKYKTIYMHYKVTQSPLEDIKVYVTYQFPNAGTQTSEQTEYYVREGTTGSWSFWYYNPSMGNAGNLTVKMYTANGTLIGEGTVFLSNS